MRIARESRGRDPRWRYQAIAVARTGGSLFVRTYERGERVHMAMLARGYDGRFAVAATPVGGLDRLGRRRRWHPSSAPSCCVLAWTLR